MGKQEKDTKNNEGDKKNDGGMNTIVLKFDMHCEGCAKKVRKSIKKLQGVENATADCSTNKLVVTGNVDSIKIKEIVEAKMKRNVELVSPTPNKAAKEGGKGGDEKKSDDKKPEGKQSEVNPDDTKKSEVKSDDKKKSEVKSDDKKKSNGKSNDKKFEDKEKDKPKEPPVATVQLKTRVHCDGCAQKIKKIVSKCKGVQDVNVDLQKDMITAKGTMNMKELLPYLNLKLKRAVELAPTKKDEATGGDNKKSKEGGDKSEKPKEGGGKSEKPKGSEGEKKDNGGDKKDSGGNNKEGSGEKKKDGGGDVAGPSNDNIGTRIEVNKMEYNPYGYDQGYGQSYTYDPRQQGQGYGHQVVEYWHGQEYSQPPQMFSDENPNACSIM